MQQQKLEFRIDYRLTLYVVSILLIYYEKDMNTLTNSY